MDKKQKKQGARPEVTVASVKRKLMEGRPLEGEKENRLAVTHPDLVGLVAQIRRRRGS